MSDSRPKAAPVSRPRPVPVEGKTKGAVSQPDSPATPPSESQKGDVVRPAPDEKLVEIRLKHLRAQREAERRLDAEEHPPVTPPPVLTLRERLAQPPPMARYRIHGYMPIDARVLIAAQQKAGKTTLVMNLVRSLVTGALFLGVAEVVPLDGPLLVIDAEMSAAQLDQWYREQGIEPDDRVLIWTLRGSLAAFNILDPTVRARWAAEFRARGVRFVVLDCLRPFFDALGLDEQHDAGKFLVAFDAFLAEAEIREAVVVQHMGHGGERARGDSRFQDWPDATWKLVGGSGDDPASARYLSAYGRDVDVSEGRLTYDLYRCLTLTEGVSRHDQRRDQAVEAIVAYLGTTADAPPSGRAIEAALEHGDHTRADIRAALKYAVRKKRILAAPGPRGANLYRLVEPQTTPATTPQTEQAETTPSAPVRRSAPSVRRARSVRQCASASIEARTAHTIGGGTAETRSGRKLENQHNTRDKDQA